MYKVYECATGWRVYSVSKCFKRLIEMCNGLDHFPSRQNAYAKVKQLTKRGDPVDKIVTFRVQCKEIDVPVIEKQIYQILQKYDRRLPQSTLVLDHVLGLIETEREILFCLDTQAEDPSENPLHEEWMPVWQELTPEILEDIKRSAIEIDGVFSVEYSFDDIKII